jgi:hypothetical protein
MDDKLYIGLGGVLNGMKWGGLGIYPSGENAKGSVDRVGSVGATRCNSRHS